MTTDIKELVKRLRGYDGLVQMSPMTTTEVIGSCQEAADALEAMAGEVARLKAHRDAVAKTSALGFSEFERVKAERDRLKDKLQAIEQGDYYGCVSEFALKALGGDAP